MFDVVPCPYFVLFVSIESSTVTFYGLDWDMLLAVGYDNGVEVFYGWNYIGEAVYVEVYEGVFYVGKLPLLCGL